MMLHHQLNTVFIAIQQLIFPFVGMYFNLYLDLRDSIGLLRDQVNVLTESVDFLQQTVEKLEDEVDE